MRTFLTIGFTGILAFGDDRHRQATGKCTAKAESGTPGTTARGRSIRNSII
jgi:hypothetical protein